MPQRTPLTPAAHAPEGASGSASSALFAPRLGPTARLHLFLARHRTAALLAALLVWGLGALLASRAHTDNSTLAFFPDSDPHMIRMAEAMDMAPFSRLLVVDFSAPDGGQTARLGAAAREVLRALPPHLAQRAAVFSLPEPQNFLRLLPSLADDAALRRLEAWSSPEAVDAAMAANHAALSGLWSGVSAPWIQHDPLNFRRIILDRLPHPPGVNLPDPALGFPLSQDGRHVLLALRPAHTLHDVRSATALMDALSEAIQAHVPSDIRVAIVGGHRHSAVNAQSIDSDIRRVAALSIAGFLLVYTFLVRSLRGAFWLLLTPLAAASLALGGVSLCWSVISGLALGFGASVLGIAEDYAVHMHFALRVGRAQGQSAADVLNDLARPLTQGFLLNICGFAVLLFSGIPALRQLAAFAMLTLSAGLLLAVVVLPLCPDFNHPPLPARRPVAIPRFPRPRAAALCALSMLCACLVLWQHVRLDATPRSLGVDMAAMQEDAALLRAVWGSRAEHLWVVRGGGAEETLNNARQVAAALRDAGQDVDTLADVWPSPAEVRANVARWEAFVAAHPHLAGLVAGAGERYGFTDDAFSPLALWLAEPPRLMDASLLRQAGLGELLDTFLEERHGKGEARSLITARGVGGDTPPAAGEKREVMPDLAPELAAISVPLSPAILEAALTRHLDREQWLLPLTGLALAALLYLCLGEARRALLAAVPPLAALTAILGWLAASGAPLTLAGMAALPLVLGLAVDHGVVATHDMAHGVAHGVDRAILTSSLTALTGMGLLALAEHPALRSMGQVIFWGLVVEVPAALWLLPRLSAPAAPQPLAAEDDV